MIASADGVRVYRNPRAAPAAAAYAHRAILDDEGFAAAAREIETWPGYAPTPLHRLPALARRLGVADLVLKDESPRFGLKSFKALGGAYAVWRHVERTIAASLRGTGRLGSRAVRDGAFAGILRGVTVTCATDGNHGRAVAWGARQFGCRCVIFVHEHVSEARCDAIARYGAEVVRVPGNYDDSVRHAAGEAARNGWTVISDTSWTGYREIPIDVMHGYGVLAREIVAQSDAAGPPTHVVVQAGVGALAAAICAAFHLAWGDERPQVVVVEPASAGCYFESGRAGRPTIVTGALDTVMAGLACGEVSPLAWPIVDAGASAYATIEDGFALEAMRVLARPVGSDPAIVAGETGAAGLALLLAVGDQPPMRDTLALTPASRVLLLGTEGDTDAALYRSIVDSEEGNAP